MLDSCGRGEPRTEQRARGREMGARDTHVLQFLTARCLAGLLEEHRVIQYMRQRRDGTGIADRPPKSCPLLVEEGLRKHASYFVKIAASVERGVSPFTFIG